MNVVRQTVLLARRDWRVETRSGDVLLVVAPFAVTALLIVAVAVGADAATLREIAPGLLWAVVLLFGSLVAVSASGREPTAHRDALTMLGVDPAASFGARASVGAASVVLVQAILAPATVVLYAPDLTGWTWLLPLVPLVGVALGALGAIAASLTAGSRASSTLVPMLVVPLALPVVVAGTQVIEGAVYGASAGPWLLLLVTLDIVIVTAGVVSAPFLEGDHR